MALNKLLSSLAPPEDIVPPSAGSRRDSKLVHVLRGSRSLASCRDSKLTRVLSGCLSRASKTVLCATVSPASYDWYETLRTLRYAADARKIKTQEEGDEESDLQVALRDAPVPTVLALCLGDSEAPVDAHGIPKFVTYELSEVRCASKELAAVLEAENEKDLPIVHVWGSLGKDGEELLEQSIAGAACSVTCVVLNFAASLALGYRLRDRGVRHVLAWGGDFPPSALQLRQFAAGFYKYWGQRVEDVRGAGRKGADSLSADITTEKDTETEKAAPALFMLGSDGTDVCLKSDVLFQNLAPRYDPSLLNYYTWLS